MRYVNLFLTIFLSCSLHAQYSLQGKISNSDGESLEFAVVYLENTRFAGVTNSQGYYVIDSIPPGSYVVKVSHTSYFTEETTIDIKENNRLDIVMDKSAIVLDQLNIVANKAESTNPFSFVDVTKEQLQSRNLGSDIPSLLQTAPSMLVTTDAGHGIGYSALSIRGSDQTRVNVSINGVPVNDAESQNVFWVNMPDLISSAETVQIQRGVGASANGPGAFAGSVLIDTRSFRQYPYLTLSGSGGSFGTLRGSVAAGTGLMNNKYFAEGRFSHIRSDGFIDRANARLQGFYFAAGKVGNNSLLRFQVVSGNEITYQAWNGVPEARFNGDSTALVAHYQRNIGSIYETQEDSVNLFTSGKTYNYYRYENQVDNYRQTQAQLSYSKELNANMSWQTTAFYTFGTGYFEQFRYNDELSDYGFTGVTDTAGNPLLSGDLARRRWLRNHFTGLVSNVKGRFSASDEWQAGIFGSIYVGGHFGEIVKTWFETNDNIFTRYYDNQGNKQDYSAYVRYSRLLGTKFSLFGDVQIRHVQYSVSGLLDDRRDADIQTSFLFFNPKVGVTWLLKKKHNLRLSYAVANKEPARSDFVDHIGATSQPTPENLQNFELAYDYTSADFQIRTGVYYMRYKNQLVLNGNLNDVGAPLRINVPRSYRLGWETELAVMIGEKLKISGNYTLSANQIENFTEVLYDYTNGFDVMVNELGTTPISYSPNHIGSLEISFSPVKTATVSWISKVVSRQFLDNTGNDARSLPGFHIHGIAAQAEIKNRFCKNLWLKAHVNNIFNRSYANNGYTYSYIFGEMITENFYFPQAGIHGYAGFEVRF